MGKITNRWKAAWIGPALVGLILLAWSYWPLERRQASLNVMVQAAGQARDLSVSVDQPLALRLGEVGRIDLNVTGKPANLVEQVGPAFFSARLEIPGLDARPVGDVRQPAAGAGGNLFYWLVEPGESGEWQGTLWLYLQPLEGNGNQGGEALLARPVSIQTISALGAAVGTVKLAGYLCLAVSGILGLFVKSGAKEELPEPGDRARTRNER